MATSGSYNYSQTRLDVINDAFQLLGVYGVGRTVSAEDMTFANSLLNKMVKAWSAKGLHLWAKTEGVLYLTPNIAEYSLGNSSSDAYVTNKSDEVVTQLNGALAAAATSVTVDSTTGMAVADKIGIVLTDKTIHWTTIATIPTSTTLTLTSGVSSTASDNALVYTFTNRLYKPLRILDARLLQGFDSGSSSTLTEFSLTSISYQDYFELPVKTTSGVCNQFHYNPRLTSGKFYVWPRPDDGSYRIQFTYERLFEDLDSASDDFDFPSEWLEALTYQLAVRLGPPFGKEKRTQFLAPLAGLMLEDLLNWNNEINSLSWVPDVEY